MSLNPVIADVTARIVARSKDSRAAYLANMDRAIENQPGRAKLSCANWAHAFAASPGVDKLRALDPNAPNIGIVSAYNDMLSAHQPLEAYPALIKDAARDVGATAQFAGWGAGHVRRCHPGPSRHGAVAVLARRDRHGDRRGPDP